MREHFVGSRELRDAVILADLEEAREAALTLAEVRGVEALPPGSELGLQEMRNRARAVSEASTLDDAARAGARLARSCADCHARYETGPGAVFDAQPPETEERSLNHGLRADRAATLLWEGVMAPADVAWQRGAAQLADGIYIPDILAGRLEGPSRIAEARERLTRLGIRAERTVVEEDRARILAEVWTECADCHRLVEGRGG